MSDRAHSAEDRAAEKQRSRDEDARALANGDKTLEQLRRENCLFYGVETTIDLSGVGRL
jgi:hypothetical protein